ncbi:helix-turn-helix transcriptional regulator [Brevibacillus sp. HB1.4B]|uniref:helix-turn-helix domain-containing protein n=1 Tax=Brevibacillus sp. HB1.4B TaxID=2738845 RepID=UPI00156AB7C8|nr:helix-turn-helix transcriptional regulator [Brevibacillus sp. HB1.4B]NRS14945.1 helix-turn-helix transcriptional regulator [Brevibacillus sp. HB1.4B]
MLDKKVFGERVKGVRLSSGLNQQEFGERLGITKQTVSGIETGYRATSLEILFEICQQFKVSSDELLGLNENDRS